MRLGRWIAAAALLAGLAVILIAAAKLEPDRYILELGLLYVATRFEQALPLVGLGFALGGVRGRPAAASAAIFALAVPLGGLVANNIAAAIAGGVDLVPTLALFAPAVCVVTGAALAVPRRLRALLLPVAALMSGVVLGMLVNLSDPTREETVFALGAVAGGVWLVAAPWLIRRQLEQAWLEIAGRIFGSWLVAIGVLLGALHLIPPRQFEAHSEGAVTAPASSQR